MSDDELDSGPRAAERLTFFSDAVVAIAMTLLAIDLPVPGGSTVSVFWTSVEHDEGHYATFLVSFVVIAAAWRASVWTMLPADASIALLCSDGAAPL